MAISFNWKIKTLDRQVDTGGVVTAHFACEAVDGEHSARVADSISFTPQTDADDFVPFELLTEEIVLSWFGSTQTEIESILTDRITRIKNPPIIKGTPW